MHAAAGVRGFRVQGEFTPQLPLRIFNLFAQQDILVTDFRAVLFGGNYIVTVDVADVREQRCELMVEKIRAMVLVESVQLVLISRENTFDPAIGDKPCK